MEVKIYKQKVKHLLYEQENHLAGLKAENMLSLKVAREEHQRQEQQHLNDKQRLTDQLYEKDRQYQEMIRDTKATQSEEVERMREHFEERVREMEKRYSTRVSTLRNDLQLRLEYLKIINSEKGLPVTRACSHQKILMIFQPASGLVLFYYIKTSRAEDTLN